MPEGTLHPQMGMMDHIPARREVSTSLGDVVGRAVHLLRAQGGGLYLCHPSRREMRCSISYNAPDAIGQVLKYGEGVPGRVAQTGRPLILNEHAWDGRQCCALLATPMIWQDRLIGVIYVLADGGHGRFTQADLELLNSFADQAALMIENARLDEQARQELAERRRAEREIKELLEKIERAKQEWESTADSLPDIICLADGTGRVIRANRTVEAWGLGKVTEVRGQEVHELLHPGCVSRRCYLGTFLREAWQEARQGQSAQCEAYDEVLERYLLVRVEPCRGGRGGELTGSTVVMVRDITERKRAEIEKVRLLHEAERLRGFNEGIVQGVAEAILMEDAEGVLTFANPAAEELLGYGCEELVGLHWTTIVPEEEWQTVRQETAKRPLGVMSRYETAILSKGGERIPVICSARPLFEEGRYVGTLSAFTDIREHKRMEEWMRVQDRLAAVGQLAAGIAHDFNNILTSIIGFAQLACMRADVPEEAKVELQPIISGGHRAARLIRQILDFSRTSVSQQQPIDLRSFLKEMFKFLERAIPESIHMVLEIGPGEYLVRADPTQIHQALANLAVNARDAMPEGGELRLRLSRLTLRPEVPRPFPGMEPGEWVALAVSDTGMGIPPDVLPHIYEPFFTTKEGGQGTGLGLSQVYGIVQQHQGYIEVETEVGKGTTFTIYLPALKILEEAPAGEVPEEIPYGHGETILLVEDEPWVLGAGQAILEHLGYRVLTASTPSEALELYGQHQSEIALVVADMVMPGMRGTELCRLLRERDLGVKVAIMTGYLLEEGQERLPDLEVSAWVQKPLDAIQLAQVVGRLLGE